MECYVGVSFLFIYLTTYHLLLLLLLFFALQYCIGWCMFLTFLRRSLVFPILLFSFISSHFSLRKSFLSLLDILWNFPFKRVYLSFSPLLFVSLLVSAISQTFPDNHFDLLYFVSWGWFWSLPPVQCYELSFFIPIVLAHYMYIFYKYM